MKTKYVHKKTVDLLCLKFWCINRYICTVEVLISLDSSPRFCQCNIKHGFNSYIWHHVYIEDGFVVLNYYWQVNWGLDERSIRNESKFRTDQEWLNIYEICEEF